MENVNNNIQLENCLESLSLKSTPCKSNNLVTRSFTTSPRTPHVKMVDMGRQSMKSQLSRSVHYKENIQDFKKPVKAEGKATPLIKSSYLEKWKDAERKYLKETKNRLDGNFHVL
jgi:hypothetical protein